MKIAIVYSDDNSRQVSALSPWQHGLIGSFENFVEWWECAAVMQREAVILTPSCSGGGDVVMV
jgi:hypothetical protein